MSFCVGSRTFGLEPASPVNVRYGAKDTECANKKASKVDILQRLNRKLEMVTALPFIVPRPSIIFVPKYGLQRCRQVQREASLEAKTNRVQMTASWSKNCKSSVMKN